MSASKAARNRLTGSQLRRDRLRAGVTQAQVADAMGTTRQRVSEIEGLSRVTAKAATRYIVAVRAAADDPLSQADPLSRAILELARAGNA